MNKSLLKLKTKGFTLVEILIVVIIVGLLAGIAVSKLGDNKERAVIAVKKSAATEINKAVQAAYVKGATLASAPATVDALVVGLQGLLPAVGGAPFTAASATEMRANIADTTANTGTLVLRGTNAGILRDVEVVWSAP